MTGQRIAQELRRIARRTVAAGEDLDVGDVDELVQARFHHREDGVVHRRRQEARVLVAELAEHAADLVVRRVARRVVLLHELLPHREPVLPGERAVDVLLVDLLPRAGDQFLLGRELGGERRKDGRRRDEQK